MKKHGGLLVLILISFVSGFLFSLVKPVSAQSTATACFTTSVGNPPSDQKAPADCQQATQTGKVPLYKQWDPRWANDSYGGCGTMKASACGPTSLAMVISYWTGKEVLPPETAKQSIHVCGSGTAYSSIVDVPRKYGLKSKQISWDEAKRYLAQGIPVIQVHNRGYFTGGGHYIVLTGDNGDGTYAVNDPDGFHRKKATEGQILASLHLTWVIQK